MRPKANKAILCVILGALMASAWAWAPRISLAFDEPQEAWPPPVLPGAAEVAVDEADKLTVVKVATPLPIDDPYAPQWWQAPYVEVEVNPQQMAMPTLAQASIEKIRVQALTNGAWIAWRVSWKDPTPDGNVDVKRFSDAVAIQFPLDPDPLPMMGNEGARVQILHWKALWQKDIDVGFQDVQDVHPHFWADLYWFAEGEFPFPVPESFNNPAARQWFVARQAGNPMASFSRRQPVEELLAEGWSTLTHQTYAVTRGKGVWVRDSWAVVFARPLRTDDPLDYQFEPGGKGQVAFAVWQGSAGNVGGRKHWSDWVEFTVQP